MNFNGGQQVAPPYFSLCATDMEYREYRPHFVFYKNQKPDEEVGCVSQRRNAPLNPSLVRYGFA
ncbi:MULTISPECIES: hypothetical protein [Rodentibacter]|uniref:hypothetical protein n=1 Tax=Rodentibacter TaxID=1960084 RepID=UPI001CFD8212|nr:hypothetical protein [Rodentibacter sp. JRC1]